MKALLIGPYMTFGGAERFLCDLGGYLRSRGHEVVLASSGGPFADELAQRGVRACGLPLHRRGAVAANALRLRRLIKQERPEVICANSFQTALLAWLAGGSRRLVFVMHNPFEDWHFLVIARLGRLFLRRVISVSDYNRRRLMARGFPGRRLKVIPNGVDTTRFAFRPPPALGEVVRLGTVARLEGYKGHRYLLEALAALEGKVGRTLLLEVVGDGPARPGLEELTERLGLAQRVRFLGKRADVPQLACRWDVFVLPSLVEALPIAVLEAMSLGVPVVATAVGGVAEVVTDGRTGLLAAPADSGALAGAIVRLLEDEPLRVGLAQAARAEVEERFAAPVVLGRFEAALFEAAAGAG